jgi:hypothetical protein
VEVMRVSRMNGRRKRENGNNAFGTAKRLIEAVPGAGDAGCGHDLQVPDLNGSKSHSNINTLQAMCRACAEGGMPQMVPHGC